MRTDSVSGGDVYSELFEFHLTCKTMDRVLRLSPLGISLFLSDCKYVLYTNCVVSSRLCIIWAITWTNLIIPSRFPLASLEMIESKPTEFFPKIGEVAERADAFEDKDPSEQAKEDDSEDRAVEEVESLCMSCGEQVREVELTVGNGFS